MLGTSPRLLQHYARSLVCAYSTSAAHGSKVGFIGLGNMGWKMAENLLHGGHELVVFDRKVEVMERFCKEAGSAAQHVGSPCELAETEDVDALITMLPNSEHVRDAFCAPDGVFAAEDGVWPALLIDSSTIDPDASRSIAEAAARVKLHRKARPCPGCSVAHPTVIDAPVSGGVAGAQAGTLTFMAGGDAEAVAAAEPFLKAMGKRVVHCGPVGSGQAAKVCNNLAMSIEMAGVAEALALGRRLGLDPKLLSDVFNTSSAQCWSSQAYNPCPGVLEGAPAGRGYKNGFAASLMAKDVSLAVAAAERLGAPTPMGQRALELYQKVMAAGHGDLDVGVIFEDVYNGGRSKEE